MPCLQGYCDAKGKCNKSIQYNSVRPWDIIENLTANKLVQFMRSNIVGTVIVLSLILWIPICCIISFVDWKARKDHKALILFRLQNENFVASQKANIEIKQAQKVSRRPGAAAGQRRVRTDDQMSLLATTR